jgi:hypothetical protein
MCGVVGRTYEEMTWPACHRQYFPDSRGERKEKER